jgi:hypothetical protein
VLDGDFGFQHETEAPQLPEQLAMPEGLTG